MTFISDDDIYDSVSSNPGIYYPSGYLLFPDGTRYRIDSGAVSWIRDRNGNKITLTGGTQVTTITDSLLRSVNISYGGPDVISLKGFGGAPRTIQITRASLSSSLRPCRSDPGYQCFASTQTYKQLFPSLDGSSFSTFNPTVISAMTLPDGRQYRFYYNSYGELARVDLPTGGTIEYDYASGSATDSTGVISGSYPADPYFEKAVYRRVVERRVYSDGNTLESKTTYGIDSNPTVVDRLSASGQLLGREKHYFNGSPTFSFWEGANSSPTYTDGREYKTEMFDANGTTVLRRIENNVQQGCTVSQWSNQIPNNPHVADVTTTLEPTAANLVAKKTFNYDCYNNLTDAYEYDFGSGAPLNNFTRRTHTDYLTVNPVNGAAYDVLNPNSTSPDINATYHLRGLPTQQSVYDVGGVERARTTYEYDQYVTNTNHALLTPRPNISGLCTIVTSPTVCDNTNPAGFLNRGNVTGTTQYLLVNNSVTGSVSAYAQYDIAGNVVKAIDGRGYATTIDYTDRFGAPDGEARANSAPTSLAGLSSNAFATKVTNALGHTNYAQFDYYLGRPVDGEDANGIVASGYYSDPLDRPTQIRRAVGTFPSLENQTTIVYDDYNHIVLTKMDRDSNNDNILRKESVYDGLGRTTETRTYENTSQSITVKQVPFIVLQDPDSGAWVSATQTSNPYRSYLGEVPLWTTTFADSVGRISKVRTTDNAIIRSSYSGNTTTVADQTGKQRKSVTDALGRLKSIYEAPNDSNFNYLTSYEYDVLDELTKVTQDNNPQQPQQPPRVFTYDSLKRLTSATNPESGTLSYQYDENGNLVVKTDSRNISTHFSYDALNRLSRRWYNSSS